MGEQFTAAPRPGLRLVGDFGEGSEALRICFPVCSQGPPAHLLAQGLGELEALQEKAWFCLLPHTPPDDHHTTHP